MYIYAKVVYIQNVFGVSILLNTVIEEHCEKVRGKGRREERKVGLGNV